MSESDKDEVIAALIEVVRELREELDSAKHDLVNLRLRLLRKENAYDHSEFDPWKTIPSDYKPGPVYPTAPGDYPFPKQTWSCGRCGLTADGPISYSCPRPGCMGNPIC